MEFLIAYFLVMFGIGGYFILVALNSRHDRTRLASEAWKAAQAKRRSREG